MLDSAERTARCAAMVARARAAVRVVKIGGRVQGEPALARAVAAACVQMPGALVIVHGGGDEVSALQRRLGHEPAFIGGRRVTGADDIAALRMGLSGLANKRLVAALVACGVSAVGISGEDAALLAAEPGDLAHLGRVGRPASVNVCLLRHLLHGGYLPVVSPLAHDQEGGGALNVNGDDAAAAIAVALEASELLFLSDVPGVLLDGAPAATLDADEARAAIARGAATGGMAAKLDAAVSALARGVARVRIGDLAALGEPARGTTVTLTTRPRSMA